VPIAAWIGIMVADVITRKEYVSEELHDPRGRYGDIQWYPLALMAIGTVVGWGLVTNAAAGWLDWQGYLLDPLGLGGKTGNWSGAGLGVLFALFLGFFGWLIPRAGGRRS
jgi:nucleobase:cation symporter-1, NCS1 family